MSDSDWRRFAQVGGLAQFQKGTRQMSEQSAAQAGRVRHAFQVLHKIFYDDQPSPSNTLASADTDATAAHAWLDERQAYGANQNWAETPIPQAPAEEGTDAPPTTDPPATPPAGDEAPAGDEPAGADTPES
jgi:hypothetical protein